MNYFIQGLKGKMGQSIVQQTKRFQDFVLTDFDHAEVTIDVSHPSALSSVLEKCKVKRMPLVIGTTGFNDAQMKQIKSAASFLPIFFSSNFSTGIAHVVYLLNKAKPLFEEAEKIEIIEHHHKSKKDAPSGTALLLKKHIQTVCQKEVNILSHRNDKITFTHEIHIFLPMQVLSITHSALDRSVFSLGALQAMRYICKQSPGFYTYEDLYEAH